MQTGVIFFFLFFFVRGELYSNVAIKVYGQLNSFTSNGVNAPVGVASASSLFGPYKVAFDPSNYNHMYVADTGNNRVLMYVNGSTAASLVYGQPNFSSNTATFLNQPFTVAINSLGGVLIADSWNHRCLYYSPGNTTFPSLVFGQPDFVSVQANRGTPTVPSASSLFTPCGVAFDSQDNAYVADSNNHRVLVYTNYLSGNTVATRVYGQPGFTSRTSNNGGISASTLFNPWGVAVAKGDAFVIIADKANNRVLRYDGLLSTTATAVYGQTNFASNSAPSPPTAYSLKGPQDVFVDPDGIVIISDAGNNRAIYYVGQTPSFVFGQLGSFTTSTVNKGGVSASSLNDIGGFAFAGTTLALADSSNSRILLYPILNLISVGETASLTTGGVVAANTTMTVAGGSLSVVGNLTVSLGGTLTVVGQSTNISITSDLLIDPESTLNVTFLPGETTIIVAKYATVKNTFSRMLDNGCNTQLTYGVSALVATQSCDSTISEPNLGIKPTNSSSSTTTPSSSSSSTVGRTVGIAVGCAVGGTAIVLAIVFFTRWSIKRRTAKANVSLKMKEISQMKAI